MQEKIDQSEIMKCLGMIMGRLDAMEKSQSRITLALIGVIAAQIGVKVLGSDPLLDIATALAIFGVVILLGCLMVGIRVIRNGQRKLTLTGIWFTVLVGLILMTQIGVYFRDIGLLNLKVVYIIRIIQNVALIGFGWNLMLNGRLFKPKDNNK